MEKENSLRHVAIIMDGNRRWAKEKNIDYRLGHKEGAKTLEKIVRHAKKIGIQYLTVYAFSTENWKRSEEEVSSLMLLLQNYLDSFSKKADTENIRINVLGDISVLSKGLQKSINKAIDRTKENDGIVFNIALNYSGRDEIVHAVRDIVKKVNKNEISIEDIDENIITENLYTKGIPDPDLVIRTSGEIRLSNFLLWQIAYSEFLFLEKFWPDFSEKDLEEAVEVYQKRNRRFGAK